MKKLTTLVVLAALLLTPALPAWAGGAGNPGLFGWFQSWLDGALSWVTGDEGPLIDPNGLTNDQATEEDGDGGPRIDPAGLTADQTSDEEAKGGPRINPIG